MENYEFIASLAIAVISIAGLLWRFETRISGVETRLGEQIAALSDRVSRIEGLLEGYFMQSAKKEE
ncbi:MAG: hypothetical protein F4X83_04155 [Chloroflexi bacterium]|nr:hypothetical protein [Chloroflexota bacterium]